MGVMKKLKKLIVLAYNQQRSKGYFVYCDRLPHLLVTWSCTLSLSIDQSEDHIQSYLIPDLYDRHRPLMR